MAAHLLGQIAVGARLRGDPAELCTRVADAADLEVVPAEHRREQKPFPAAEVRVV